jgi:hypothetical protein
MSKTNETSKKVVRLNEDQLVDLIDNIVNETVAVKKKQWLAEQAKKNESKTAVLESRINALEKLISNKK